MFGVLASPRSVFINEKAFRLCHPPKLSGRNKAGWETVVDDDGYELEPPDHVEAARMKNPRRNSELTDLRTHQTPAKLARGRSYSVMETSASSSTGTTTQPWNMTTAQVFAPLSSTSRLSSSVQMLQNNATPEETSNSGVAAGTSSSRHRSGSGSALTRMLKFGSSSSNSNNNNAGPSTSMLSSSEGAITSGSGSRSRNWLRRIGSRDSQEGRSSDDQQRNNQGGLEEVPEDASRSQRGNVPEGMPLPTARTTVNEDGDSDRADACGSGWNGIRHDDIDRRRTTQIDALGSLPYSIMTHPCPAPSHALYPNYTPRGKVAGQSDENFPLDPIFPGSGDGESKKETNGTNGRAGSRHGLPGRAGRHGVDTRQYHPILKERKWLQGVVKDGGRVVPSEWVQNQGQDGGEALTWVGPVL